MAPTTSPRRVLGRVLRALRKRAGMSQADLCAELGLQQASLSRLENGSVACTFDHLVAASRELGAEPSEVMSVTERTERRLGRVGVVVTTTGEGLEISSAVIDEHVAAALKGPASDLSPPEAGPGDSDSAVPAPPGTESEHRAVLSERYDYSDGDAPFAAIRRQNGMTQQEAADAVGKSRSLWSAWESNTRPITVEQLQGVVDAFGLTPGDIARVLQHCEPGNPKTLTAAHLLLVADLTPTADFDPIHYLTRAWSIPTP